MLSYMFLDFVSAATFFSDVWIHLVGLPLLSPEPARKIIMITMKRNSQPQTQGTHSFACF
jgi:hypothetical protein